MLGEKTKVLVYGKPKEGKTFGAATWPRPNFIVFDPDGISTLVGKDFRTKHPDVSCMYEAFIDTDLTKQGVARTHKAFDSACEYFDACMKTTPTKWVSPTTKQTELVSSNMFDTWVIDSGTTLSHAVMNKAIVLLGQSGLGIKSETHKTALSTGMLFAKQQDYGAEISMIVQFIRMVLNADKHVVLICHEKEVTNDEGRITSRTPLLTGQAVPRVCALFTEIWHLRTVKSGPSLVRKLTTVTDGITVAGTRYGIADGTEFNFASVQSQLQLTMANA